MQNTYIISETENINALNEGYKVEANNLQQAKHIAMRNQTFQGTVLKVGMSNGVLLAYKLSGERWKNAEENIISFLIEQE